MERGKLIYFLVLGLVFFLVPFSSAIVETYCVEASVTDISPSSIGIDEEFTIGVQIENCGSKIPEFVYFELITIPTDVSVKEALKIKVSNLYYGNSERFILYHMRIAEDAVPGEHIIKTRLSYGDEDSSIIKDDSIVFEVRGESAELNIASAKTKPVLPIEGETVELTLRLENTGKGTAKSVKIYADHPFKGVKQAFIGSLRTTEDGPAIFTFVANESGEFEFPITIEYNDDFGDKETKTNIEINVLEKESNIGKIIFIISLIAFIGIILFYFIRKGKSKDRIIHQLLKGNHHTGKGGK